MSIEVRELHQHYGATRAVDGVSLTLPDDVQVLALIDPEQQSCSNRNRLLQTRIRSPLQRIRIHFCANVQ